MPRDYLEPDRGNPADLLVAGAMATMFFTPLMGKMLGGTARGLFRGAKKGGKAAYGAVRNVSKKAFTASKTIDKGQLLNDLKGYGSMAYEGVVSAGRMGGRTAEWVIKNRGRIAPAIFAGAVVGGAARGISDRSPSGPESYTTFEGGMPADNLGATGDLTLALHNRRR